MNKAIERVTKILKKKISTTHEELQSLVGLFSFIATVIYLSRALLQRLHNTLAQGGKYLHLSKPIADNLLLWEKFLPRWNEVTLLRSHRQCYSL